MNEDGLNNGAGKPADESARMAEPNLGRVNETVLRMMEEGEISEPEPQIIGAARGMRRRNPPPKKRGPRAVLVSLVLFAAVLLAGTIAYVYITVYMPNYSREDFYQRHAELDPETLYILAGGELLGGEYAAGTAEGSLYLPVSFAADYLDEYIFWDSEAGRLILTTETRVTRISAGDRAYTVNGKPARLGEPVLNIGGEGYIPASFLERAYNISVSQAKENNIVIVDFLSQPREIVQAADKTVMRYEPDLKSVIAADAEKGELFTRLGEEGDFTRVRSESGLVGFVKTKSLKRGATIPAVSPAPEAPAKTPEKIAGRIIMCWDQIENMDANQTEERREPVPGLDVISPTWFSFDREALDGTLFSLADRGYVDWAHENGYRVWALLTDNFDGDIGRYVLGNTAARERAISQILGFVEIYGLDGINIDFEMIRKDDAVYYIQFLRELYPMARELGAVVSVDMYVPKPYNLYYNRAEAAKASDYIIIMGYDEHYAGSEESGPVASIGFVMEGITETLKEVPASKIILGVPFFNRVWYETLEPEGLRLSANAYSMDRARSIFEEREAEFIWLEDMACYYAEYDYIDENGNEAAARVWLEDERSLEEKLGLAVKYKLAGVSGWRRGLESQGAWPLIRDHMK